MQKLEVTVATSAPVSSHTSQIVAMNELPARSDTSTMVNVVDRSSPATMGRRYSIFSEPWTTRCSSMPVPGDSISWVTAGPSTTVLKVGGATTSAKPAARDASTS